MSRIRNAGFLVVCTWCSFLLGAQSTPYFVSVNGTDTSDGLSPATAFRTVSRGLEPVDVDLLSVGPGVFPAVNLTLTGSSIEIQGAGSAEVRQLTRSNGFPAAVSCFRAELTHVHGIAQTTLDASFQDRVLSFISAPNVTLSHMTLQGGNWSGPSGQSGGCLVGVFPTARAAARDWLTRARRGSSRLSEWC